MNHTNKIVNGMCLTSRHDYHLDKVEGSLSSGMTDAERDALYRQMHQLYYHNVLPVISALEYELDGMTDEIATLKADNTKLLNELRHERDVIARMQNNGQF